MNPMRAEAVPAAFHLRAGPHRIDFRPGGAKLAVTFDHAALGRNGDPAREPWSLSFFRSLGYSVLGLIPLEADWYRSRELHAALTALETDGFFRRFPEVVMAGPSMGGLAACVFASLAPGCTVLAYNPRLVGWVPRSAEAAEAAWTGRFSDPVAESMSAARVHLFYDPFDPIDAPYAAAFRAGHVRHHRVPFTGHRVAAALRQLGVLREVGTAALSDRLTPPLLARTLRGRRNLATYHVALVQALWRHGRVPLALRLCEAALARFDEPRLVHLAPKLRASLSDPSLPPPLPNPALEEV